MTNQQLINIFRHIFYPNFKTIFVGYDRENDITKYRFINGKSYSELNIPKDKLKSKNQITKFVFEYIDEYGKYGTWSSNDIFEIYTEK